MGHDPAAVRVGVGDEPRVVWKRGSGVGVDSDDGAIQRHGVAARSHVLAAKRAAFVDGIGNRRRGRGLAPVCVVEAGTVAAARVKRTVRAEHQGPGRVAGELLRPVSDEHLFVVVSERPHPGVADVEPGKSPRHDTAVARGSRRVRAALVGVGRSAPSWRRTAGDRVVGVEHVHIRDGRERRMERHAEHAPVPEVVDRQTQIGDERRRRVREAVERPDASILLGHEQAAIRREFDDRGLGQPGLRQELVNELAGRRRERPADGRHLVAGQVAGAAHLHGELLAACELGVRVERRRCRRGIVGDLRRHHLVRRVSKHHRQGGRLNRLAENGPDVDERGHTGGSGGGRTPGQRWRGRVATLCTRPWRPGNRRRQHRNRSNGSQPPSRTGPRPFRARRACHWLSMSQSGAFGIARDDYARNNPRLDFTEFETTRRRSQRKV